MRLQARRAISRAAISLAALLLFVFTQGDDLFTWGDEPSSRPDLDVPKLLRSERVIAEKIARKEAKLSGKNRAAKHPDDYAAYRKMVRTHPEGTTIPELLMAAKRHVEGMPWPSGDRDAGLWNWDWLGPGNIGGRVRALLLHPTNSNIMWIGSAGGGIWKTTNAGADWYPLRDLLPSLAISGLAMDPNDPDVLYAASGEHFPVSGALPGAGVFKSIDGGGNWTQMPDIIGTEAYCVNDIAHHPSISNVVIAAASTDEDEGRIWRTSNGGDDWGIVLSTPHKGFDIDFDPDDPSVVIAGTADGAWRSEFGGAPGTWEEISIGLDGLPDHTGRCEIAFHEGSDVVYASCAVDQGEDVPRGDIWRSLDNGLTWDRRLSGGYLGSQGGHNNTIWVEPADSDRIMVGGIDLFRSDDGGATLTIMSNWRMYHVDASAHADQHLIVPHIYYNGDSNRTIFFCNDGGIQKNIYGFQAQELYGWVNLANNLGITQFYNADVTPDGNTILGGTQDNDDLRFRREHGPQAWYQADTGDGTYNAINPNDPSIMYAAYVRLQMEKSIDGGLNYFDIYEDILDAGDRSTALFIAPFALDKVAPYILLAGGESIWRSTNEGHDWHRTLEHRPGWPLCSAIEISPTAGSLVAWVGYTDGQIWKTENGCVTWTEVEGPGGQLPDRHVTDIEISPHDPETILVSMSGYWSDRVWITDDNGTTWTSMSDGGPNALPEVHTSCVSFHPIDPDWIYAGTDIGLFASEDQGQNWNVTSRYGWNEGPVFTEISDLLWHSYCTLIAVTHGRGMFECTPLPTVWVDQDNMGEEDGTQMHPWNTFTEGRNEIGNGATLIIKGGDYDEGDALITKRIEILGSEGTVLIR